ncbi:MAG: hypothetical protein KDA92_26335, partial [Planctomycetales bacterium]|nr:hypothetical protein [Planctomycetales bacterium]
MSELRRRRCTLQVLFVAAVLSGLALGSADLVAAEPVNSQSGDRVHLEFFEQRVRPVLVEHCYECHSSDTEASGGLKLDSRAGWQQ